MPKPAWSRSDWRRSSSSRGSSSTTVASKLAVNFDTDMSSIREDGRGTLAKQPEWLKKYTNYPITIEGNPKRVVVTVAGRVVADTRAALTLREASYPPVQYIPRGDVDMSLLARTDHATYCPYKGDCTYYSVPIGGKESINAVWTYENPYPAVAQIKGYLAFYPDRVDEVAEQPPTKRESSKSGPA